MTGGPGKEHRTNKPPPTRRVQGSPESDATCPTISQNPSLWHPFGWTKRAPPGRTLTQNDWLKTTQKPIPSPSNPRLQATWQSSPPGFPYPTALCPGAPSQLNLMLCQHVCLLGQFISECLTRAQFWALEGVPLLATGPPELIPEQCTPWIYFSEFLSYMRWSTDTLISLSIKNDELFFFITE